MPTDDLDEDLSRRFASLRNEDRMRVPPMPDMSVAPAAFRRKIVSRPAVAAAAVAAIFAAAGVVGLRTEFQRQDPVVIYAALSPAWPSETDYLLNVSTSALPGTTQWPQIFDESGNFAAGRNSNGSATQSEESVDP